jgi:hypothetical protein
LISFIPTEDSKQEACVMGSAMCKSESAPLRAVEEGVFVKTGTEENEDAGIEPIWEVDGGIWGEKKKKKSFKEFLFGLDDRLFVALVGEFSGFLVVVVGVGWSS